VAARVGTLGRVPAEENQRRVPRRQVGAEAGEGATARATSRACPIVPGAHEECPSANGNAVTDSGSISLWRVSRMRLRIYLWSSEHA
jgi:hypothetical protein